WDSAGMSSVPADCDVLVIAGPRRTLAGSEEQAVDTYLKKGGRALMMLDPSIGRDQTISPSGLEEVLRSYGLNLGLDLAVDHRDPSIILRGGGMETLFLKELPDHPVTKSLAGTAALFRIARSVTPATPAPVGYEVTSLAKTSPEGWGARDLVALTKGGPLQK